MLPKREMNWSRMRFACCLLSILLVCFLSVGTALAEPFEEEDNLHGKSPVPVGSCQPSNSMSVMAVDKQVFSFVPKGTWSMPKNDVVLVNVEPYAVALKRIQTKPVSSCASNSRTGQTVCTNEKDVYVFSPPELEPRILQSDASGVSLFSSGSCTTCAVTMDAIHNKALVSLSLLVPPPGTPPGNMATSGFQYIDLGSKPQAETAFRSEAPKAFDPGGEISQGILVDPIRNWILSPNESGNFEIIKVIGQEDNGEGERKNQGNNKKDDNDRHDKTANDDHANNSNGDTGDKTRLAFFENNPIVDPQVAPVAAAFASAAEECQTGIALATLEGSFPSEVYLVDLKKVGFNSGSPGSWPTPSSQDSTSTQELEGSLFPESGSGPNGVAVAQGTSIGLLTGLGSSSITAFKLPESSVHGTPPAIGRQDYITCQFPDMTGAGPHTLNAYRSPNTGHAMAVVGNMNGTALWRIDLTEMLKLQSTHHVCNSGSIPPELLHKIVLP